MVSQDILGGLKIALARGKSLEETMQAFYNAGYPKEEIEEATRLLHTTHGSIPPPRTIQPPQQKNAQQIQLQLNPASQLSTPKPNIQQAVIQNPVMAQQPAPVIRQPSFQQLSPRPLTPQLVSSYDHKPSKIDPITIILVVVLLVLLGVLGAIFFYKDQLINFLNQYLE